MVISKKVLCAKEPVSLKGIFESNVRFKSPLEVWFTCTLAEATPDTDNKAVNVQTLLVSHRRDFTARPTKLLHPKKKKNSMLATAVSLPTLWVLVETSSNQICSIMNLKVSNIRGLNQWIFISDLFGGKNTRMTCPFSLNRKQDQTSYSNFQLEQVLNTK